MNLTFCHVPMHGVIFEKCDSLIKHPLKCSYSGSIETNMRYDQKLRCRFKVLHHLIQSDKYSLTDGHNYSIMHYIYAHCAKNA